MDFVEGTTQLLMTTFKNSVMTSEAAQLLQKNSCIILWDKQRCSVAITGSDAAFIPKL